MEHIAKNPRRIDSRSHNTLVLLLTPCHVTEAEAGCKDQTKYTQVEIFSSTCTRTAWKWKLGKKNAQRLRLFIKNRTKPSSRWFSFETTRLDPCCFSSYELKNSYTSIQRVAEWLLDFRFKTQTHSLKENVVIYYRRTERSRWCE